MRLYRVNQKSVAVVGMALLLVFITTGLAVFFDKSQQHDDQLKAQGYSIVQVLSMLPAATLLESNKSQGAISAVWGSASVHGFAYLLLTDATGTLLAKQSLKGVVVPPVVLPRNAIAEVTKRTISISGDNPSVIEFRAPFFSDTELVGYVMVGIAEFGFLAYLSNASFLMALATPIFLLLPLFYFLLGRESEPMAKIREKLFEQTATQSGVSVDVHQILSPQAVLQKIEQVFDVTRDRMSRLEHDHVEMLATTKLLSYQQTRMLTVIESLPDAVLVMDEFGAATMANAKLSDVLSMDLEKIIDKKTAEWCEYPEVLKLLSGLNSGYFARDHLPVEFSPTSDPQRTIAVSVFPMFQQSASGGSTGSVVVFRDATSEIVARNSRSEFVAKLGHELKSPLTVIAMYSEILIDEESEDIRVDGLNVIRDETERASGLISNMLSITKMETGSLSLERTRVRVQDLLEDSVTSISRLGLQDEVIVNIDCPQELGALALDKDLMRVAVHNLLTNAIKYNRPGGTVTLAAEESDSVLTIRVKDTGIGISEEDQKKVFEKFFRSGSDEACLRPGHGLGLALAHEIIGLHHGTLSVSSVVGEGTEFTIELRKQANKLRKTG